MTCQWLTPCFTVPSTSRQLTNAWPFASTNAKCLQGARTPITRGGPRLHRRSHVACVEIVGFDRVTVGNGHGGDEYAVVAWPPKPQGTYARVRSRLLSRHWRRQLKADGDMPCTRRTSIHMPSRQSRKAVGGHSNAIRGTQRKHLVLQFSGKDPHMSGMMRYFGSTPAPVLPILRIEEILKQATMVQRDLQGTSLLR